MLPFTPQKSINTLSLRRKRDRTGYSTRPRSRKEAFEASSSAFHIILCVPCCICRKWHFSTTCTDNEQDGPTSRFGRRCLSTLTSRVRNLGLGWRGTWKGSPETRADASWDEMPPVMFRLLTDAFTPRSLLSHYNRFVY